MKKTNHKNKKNGFVILIAVLISSLMISLGAFIASIAVKELILSTSGRDSQIAFYAADSAIECALYQDLRIEPFAASSTAPGPSEVQCNGLMWSIDSQSGEDDSATTYFDVDFVHDLPVSVSPYARVKVIKENIGTINDRTVIEAQGYNVKDPDSPNRVERALQVIY